MRLSDLLQHFAAHETAGNTGVTVGGLAYDSRRVKPGDLFFALPGVHANGITYADEAVDRGAVGIVAQQMPAHIRDGIGYVVVNNVHTAMSGLSARFYDYPSRQIPVIGVTGTDGKTSVTYFIDQLLSCSGEESGFLSTALVKTDVKVEPNHFRQSTPEAPEIHAALFEMVENGRAFAVLEATSHGLSEKTGRLKDVDFRTGVFTNLSPEHLDFHGTVEQYRCDKVQLFRNLDKRSRKWFAEESPIFGVVFGDDPSSHYFRQATRVPVYSYGINRSDNDLSATDIRLDARGTECKIRWRNESRKARIPMPGVFNVENVLAALLTVAQLLDTNPLDLVEYVPQLRPVPGRMHVVRSDTPFVPIVDYAHTPGAYQKVLPEIKQTTRNRLILVFGSAGERDREKRAELGKLAAQHGDVIILTDEDPRGEQPLAIIEQIASGCLQERPDIREGEELFVIAPRRDAVEHAVRIAARGDTILFLGKGHEQSIVYADHSQPWDEATEVEAAIEKVGEGNKG